MVKNPSAVWENWVRSLGWEDPPEKGTATHSSILTWRIPWTEEPGRLQSIGLLQAFEKIYLMWQTQLTLVPLYHRTLYVTSNLLQSFNSIATRLKTIMIPFIAYSVVYKHLSSQLCFFRKFRILEIFRFLYSIFLLVKLKI